MNVLRMQFNTIKNYTAKVARCVCLLACDNDYLVGCRRSV